MHVRPFLLPCDPLPAPTLTRSCCTSCCGATLWSASGLRSFSSTPSWPRPRACLTSPAQPGLDLVRGLLQGILPRPPDPPPRSRARAREFLREGAQLQVKQALGQGQEARAGPVQARTSLSMQPRASQRVKWCSSHAARPPGCPHPLPTQHQGELLEWRLQTPRAPCLPALGSIPCSQEGGPWGQRGSQRGCMATQMWTLGRPLHAHLSRGGAPSNPQA